jgi:hypothetical protein
VLELVGPAVVAVGDGGHERRSSKASSAA